MIYLLFFYKLSSVLFITRNKIAIKSQENHKLFARIYFYTNYFIVVK